MFVGFAAPRLMAFPDWDLLSVLTPEASTWMEYKCFLIVHSMFGH